MSLWSICPASVAAAPGSDGPLCLRYHLCVFSSNKSASCSCRLFSQTQKAAELVCCQHSHSCRDRCCRTTWNLSSVAIIGHSLISEFHRVSWEELKHCYSWIQVFYLACKHLFKSSKVKVKGMLQRVSTGWLFTFRCASKSNATNEGLQSRISWTIHSLAVMNL